MDHTSRLQLAKIVADPATPETADAVSALRSAINDHANKLDTAGLFIHGPASGRPPAGIIDRYHYADDTGVLSRDTGTAWRTVAGALADIYDARPSAATELNGLRFLATDKRMEWQCIAGAWVLINVFAPEVTSLPASPIDQQECMYLADAANGVKWHFRYRAASTSAEKWEFIGGQALFAESSTQGTRPAGAGYGDLAGTGIGPSIVAPLGGSYDVEFGAWITNNNPGATSTVAPEIATNPVLDDDAIAGGEDANSPVSPSKLLRRPATVGAVIALRYASSAGTATFTRRYIAIRPNKVA